MAAPNEGAFGKLGTIGLAEVGMLGWFRPGVWPSAPLPWWVGAVPRTLPPSLSTMSSEALQRAQNVWPSRCPGNGVGWRSELLPCCGAGYLADKEVCACMLLECASRMCPGDRGPWPSVCVPLWSSVAWDRVTAPQLGSRAPPSDPRSPVPVRSMALLSLLCSARLPPMPKLSRFLHGLEGPLPSVLEPMGPWDRACSEKFPGLQTRPGRGAM